jgi:hypothetical protein
MGRRDMDKAFDLVNVVVLGNKRWGTASKPQSRENKVGGSARSCN